MIDWMDLAFNSAWILGLSLAVAVPAIVFGEHTPGDKGFWNRLSQPGPQASLSFAFLLFCAGQAGFASRPWEFILWLLVAFALSFYTIRDLAQWRKSRSIYSTQKVDPNKT